MKLNEFDKQTIMSLYNADEILDLGIKVEFSIQRALKGVERCETRIFKHSNEAENPDDVMSEEWRTERIAYWGKRLEEWNESLINSLKSYEFICNTLDQKLA